MKPGLVAMGLGTLWLCACGSTLRHTGRDAAVSPSHLSGPTNASAVKSVSTEPPPVPVSLLPAVPLTPAESHVAAADQLAKAGEGAQALVLYQQVIFAEPTAVRSVEGAVLILAERPDAAQGITDLCNRLVREERHLQAIACVEAAIDRNIAIAVPIARSYAQLPSLMPQDIAVAARADKSLAFLPSAIENCREDSHIFEPFFFRDDDEDDPLAAIYSRLADNLPDQEACLRRAAMERCLKELGGPHGCSDVRSIARYVEVLSRQGAYPVASFMDFLFGFKGNLYRKYLAGNDKAQRALFELHIALAYACSVLWSDAAIRKYWTQWASHLPAHLFSPRYHFGRARLLWKKLHAAEPFPEEYGAGLKLDD